MPFLKINDIKFFYNLHGDQNLQPIVLISGYTADHKMWEPLLPFLKDSYYVLTFDNQGIGQTKDTGNPLSLETMADNIFNLMQSLKLNMPIIVGYAMGSTLAQELAIKHSDNISKLVLINSVAKWSNKAITDVEKLLELRKSNQLDSMFGMLYDLAFSTKYKKTLPRDDYIKRKKEAATKVNQSILDQERQLSTLRKFDSRDRLAQIDTDTLIISSIEDPLGTIEDAKILEQCISNAVHQQIPTGHAAIYEQPEQISKLILDFTTPSQRLITEKMCDSSFHDTTSTLNKSDP